MSDLKWFKFYGQDYLTDPKMLSLSPTEKALWITILCLASANNGVIKYINEEKLMTLTGIDPLDDEWNEYKGFLDKFVTLSMITHETTDDNDDNKMITIVNFIKRQESNLSSYERVKKYREKSKNEAKNDNKRNVINDNARIDKNRIDKNIEKKIYKRKDFSSLKDISSEVISEIATNYKVPAGFVNLQFEKLKNYCESKGKKYSNYKAALRNFVVGEMQRVAERGSQNVRPSIDARNI